jgi:hypothetical protein
MGFGFRWDLLWEVPGGCRLLLSLLYEQLDFVDDSGISPSSSSILGGYAYTVEGY